MQDDSGATALEYGLIVGLIGLGMVTAMTGLVSDLADLFSEIRDGVREAAGLS
ncbi:Flp family type IVb pilin [Cohaesibacter sp. ES.047]|uniref:Flp family type IVb pilin n=1 Tax=Cohaesibacter sp. ES.047 TaxID=1798205 RepID=UPI001FCE9C67|nr:Flp family type IVb pilin [Cohaesibacter sp. ES.047]